MTHIYQCHEINEGDGAKVRRIIGNQHNHQMDPFLMLDFFKVKLPAGFPDHPHRGFETVTYMISGTVLHQDFKGHSGKLGPQSVQWMTAGRGIVHAEMPASFDEYSIGFQLWINLSKDNKFCEPQYQEFEPDQVQVAENDAVIARILSGEVEGVKGKIIQRTSTDYIDFLIKPNQSYSYQIKPNYSALIFVFENSLNVNGKSVQANHAIRFANSPQTQTLELKNTTNKPSRLLFIAGQPINEPVVQQGPFVLNTKQQLQQTFEDYYEAKNGFEGANTWQSQIKNLKYKK